MGLLEKPITTQEDLDALIDERLEQDREEQEKKYEGWLSPVAKAEADQAYEEQIEALQAQNRKYETAALKQKVAREVGLDWSLADRLTGETEEEIRQDAESLKALVKTNNAPPLRTYEADKGTKNTETAWKDVLSQLRGE